ncbi:hypothetical protein M9978_20190 [Sphingomonas sp. MG17]|uniref:TAP-like protein n=1 Tax=Sphingomonas tagetis TaxID=2949092 RepID=A0A9X2HN53_9SPHN|nr:hypothetical protein [Sphingomonas tagetis]MCP3732742.1 hypothetical protein [Sphingomonas tagetis]
MFDMRLTAEPPVAFSAAVERYLRRDLRYVTALPYVGLWDTRECTCQNGKAEPRVGERLNDATASMSEAEVAEAVKAAAASGDGPPKLGPPLPAVDEAVAINPRLRVLVVAGRFDSLASCAGNDEQQRRLPVSLSAAMTFSCYDGGHMFYRDEHVRSQFTDAVASFKNGGR